MLARTCDDLITDVRSRVAAPTSDLLVTDTELLSFADQELRTEIAQILIAARSEYWLESSTQAVTASTATYRLPDRAMGMGLRDVTLYDSANVEWNLAQIPADRRYFYNNPNVTGLPSAFTLENGQITLLPTPSSSDYTIRFRYYALPSRLIPTSSAAKINSASDTTTLTLDTTSTPPSSVTTVSARIDVVRGGGMFEAMFQDRIVKTWSTPTLTIDGNTPIVVADISTSTITNTRADYVCPSGKTVFPPIPELLWPVLVAATVRAYAEAIGDARAMDAADAMFQRKKATAVSMLTPRVDGEVERIVPLGTPLRSGRRRLGNILTGVR